ncbi:hypothetical protein EYF80_057791 [Liparis tanakae]|uniref:Uncharacterized protein n=1 Tax=Liparis tanakae TaxID=230148 RepID=A0A4Z2ETZ1_9TELE|nr:hypothetical protein EYF80_057791 [Liparis tanakae]
MARGTQGSEPTTQRGVRGERSSIRQQRMFPLDEGRLGSASVETDRRRPLSVSVIKDGSLRGGPSESTPTERRAARDAQCPRLLARSRCRHTEDRFIAPYCSDIVFNEH